MFDRLIMSYSTIQEYLFIICSHVPLIHWAIIVTLSISFAILVSIHKGITVYATLVLGIIISVALFIFDAAVFIRFRGYLPHGYGIDILGEIYRLFHNPQLRKIEFISNVAVFIPLGFFLSEFLFVVYKFSHRRLIGLVIVSSLCYSLCIECIQIILKAGYFEFTDVLLNTSGALIGAYFSLLARKVIRVTENRLILFGYTHNSQDGYRNDNRPKNT